MTLETSQAELEELERTPRPPNRLSQYLLQVLKTGKRGSGPPRDELGRFTNPKKRKGKAGR